MNNLTKYTAIIISMLFAVAATSGSAHASDRVYVSVPSVVVSIGGHHSYKDKYYYSKNKAKKLVSKKYYNDYSNYGGKSYYKGKYFYKNNTRYNSSYYNKSYNKGFKSIKSFNSNKGFNSRRTVNTRSRSSRRF